MTARRLRVASAVVAVVLIAVAFSPTLDASLGGPQLGDPFMSMQWGLAVVNATGAWQTTAGDPGVVVGVVDSGVDLAHLDLLQNLWDGNRMHGTSVARPFGIFADLPVGAHTTTMDELGHGTQVAGVVAAVAENGLGVRGMAQVPIMVVKVYGLGATGHVEALADGIRWAAANGARVITVSISASNHPVLHPAILEAWCAGAVIVASAGNSGNPVPQYPARYPEVIAVGAIDASLAVWPDSNRGVALYAPGVDVFTTQHGNLYGAATGTSFAAPFVAGAAALVIAANPQLSNVDVVEILLESGRALPGADAPLLDAGAAVDLAGVTLPGPGAQCP